MKKRILSLLLALVMLLGLLPTVALAANETQETPSVTVYFSLTDDDQYVVGDNKDGGSRRSVIKADQRKLCREGNSSGERKQHVNKNQ